MLTLPNLNYGIIYDPEQYDLTNSMMSDKMTELHGRDKVKAAEQDNNENRKSNFEEASQIFHRNFTEASRKLHRNLTDEYSASQLKVLYLLTADPFLTTDEMAEIIGISRRSILSNIKQLKNKGILIRHGADKGGYWEVIRDIFF